MAIQPWAIDGAKLNGAQARSQLFKATSGARGVTLPGDLKVKALPTPGAFVRIGPGGATLPNDYLANGGGQSYGTLMVASEDLPVPATGSGGGATRYVIQRIIDPEYSGQPPADPLTYRYDPFVLVSSVSTLPYPYVVLAKINQPANTATITNAMIEDLREVANPREITVRRPRQIHAGDPGQVLNSTAENGEVFPNVGQQSIYVPEWATRAQISADWTMVRTEANKNPFGNYWVEYGPWMSGSDWERSTEKNGFNSGKVGDAHYGNWLLRSDVYIPVAYRGTTISFVFKAKYTGADKGISVTALSGMNLDVRFMQVADPSTS